jgi:hypothetical protein
MANRRVPHRQPRPQSSAATDAFLPLKDAQAAAWLLDQLHVSDLAGPALEQGHRGSPPPEELRASLTAIAVKALQENLADVRGLLERAAAPKAVA